jgi:branched-chain amino acid aminotransferase
LDTAHLKSSTPKAVSPEVIGPPQTAAGTIAVPSRIIPPSTRPAPAEEGLAEVRRLARVARVFVSMPFVEGVTPRVLGPGGRSAAYPTDEVVERREGTFALDEIGLPALDHGVLYGDAVFEGVLVAHGRLFTWREHLERLHASAASLGIAVPLDDVHLTERLLEAVRATGVTAEERGYIRLVVTRGLGDLGIAPQKCVGPTVYAVCATLQLYPEAGYRTGIGLSVAREIRRPPAEILDPRVKSCNYLNNIRALLETLPERCAETLMLTPEGFVAEATADNLFLVLKEPGWEDEPSRVRVVTPSPDYCLNGITRALLMRAARELGYRAEESAGMLPDDWTGPDREAFLTGTGAGVMPVVAVAGAPVGDGAAGPVTARLRARFNEYLADPAMGVALDATPAEITAYLGRPAVSENFVVELFRRVDSRDWEGLRESFAPDAVYERPGYEPLVGLERLLHFYREERVIAAGEHRLEHVVIDGDTAACWGRFVGIHKNGSPIDERFADCYTLEDGRIKTRRSFFFRPAV